MSMLALPIQVDGFATFDGETPYGSSKSNVETLTVNP